MIYCDSFGWTMYPRNNQSYKCSGSLESPLGFLKSLFLNATIRFHLERYLSSNKSLVQQLLQSTYVDDIITGGESEDQGFNLYSQAKEMFRTGGFNLRKFLTNSRALQEQIDRAEGLKLPTMEDAHCIEETYAEATLGGLQCTDVGEYKVLGVSWNPNSDQLIVDVTELAQLATTVQLTKRNLISVIGKFYDPLGLLAPVTI